MNKSVVYLLLIVVLSVLVTVLSLQPVDAQTMPSLSQNQELLSLYEQGLDSAIIQQYSSPVTDAEYYYLASSYVRLGQYNQALILLSPLINASNSEQSLWWSAEASLAQSRVLFYLGNYASALEQAFDLSILSTSTSDQKRRSSMFVDDILEFLSPSSLAQLFTNHYPFELKASILEGLMYVIPYELANTFYSELQELALASGESNNLTLSRIERQLSTPIQYRSRYNPTKQFGAPDGFHYRLGVLLPTYSVENPRYAVVQDLYKGMSFAAEEFNANTPDAKMFLIYKSTTDTLSAGKQVDTEYSEIEHFAHTQISSLVIGDRVNAIIGPLFSNEAPLYAPLAEEYEIPLFLPLANADSLDLHNNYMFQVNPSFSSQGSILARYAVETLGFDTLGILAEKGSLGEAAAHSFLREAERLGAFVAYDFIENLEEQGYGITDFTQYFTTDTLDSVTIIDAVYAHLQGLLLKLLSNPYLQT